MLYDQVSDTLQSTNIHVNNISPISGNIINFGNNQIVSTAQSTGPNAFITNSQAVAQFLLKISLGEQSEQINNNANINFNNFQGNNLSTPINDSDIATKLYVDSSMGTNLSLAQISVQNPNANNVDMNSFQIQNVIDPILPQDAATKNYVDINNGSSLAQISVSHPNLANVDMHSFQINNLLDPTSNQDAATKNYVDMNTGFSLSLNQISVLYPNTNNVDMHSFQIKNIVDPTQLQDAATKSYVDNSAFLPLSSTLNQIANQNHTSASVDMNNQKLINLAIPTLAQDAVNLSYMQSHTLASTDTLNDIATINSTSGDVDMNMNKLINLTDPTLPQDAMTLNYFNSHGLSSTATLNQIANTNLTSGDVNINVHKLLNVQDPISAQQAATKNYVDTTTVLNPIYFASTTTLNDISTLNSTSGDVDMNMHKIVNVTDPTLSQDAATKNYVDNSSFLPLNSTLNSIATANPTTADVDMNSHKIINILDPVNPQDTASKHYVDHTIILNPIYFAATTSLDEISDLNSTQGIIDMNMHKIVNVTDPTLLQDVATKNYVDNSSFLPLNTTLNDISSTNATSGDVDINSHKLLNVLDPTLPQDAATKNYVDNSSFLPLNSTLNQIATLNPTSGDVNINVHKLLNVQDPISAQQAATKNYVDTTTVLNPIYFASTTTLNDISTLNSTSGDVDMNMHKIVNVTDPTLSQDAATKNYVDNSSFLPANSTLNSIATANPTTADVDMNSHKIINILDPVNPQDTASKHYVDTTIVLNPIYLPSTTTLNDISTLNSTSGDVDMNMNKIVGLLDPTSAQDAMTLSYMNSHTLSSTATLNFISMMNSTSGNVNMNVHKITNVLDPTLPQDAATMNYVDTTTNLNPNYMPATETLDQISTNNPTAGNINMQNNKIISLFNPSAAQDAATKNYVDTTITANPLYMLATRSLDEIAVINMTHASVDMNSYKIINLLDPTLPQDAATKNYVDNSSFLPITSTLNEIATQNPTSGSVDMNNNDLINTNIVSNSNLDSLDLSTTGQINLNISNTPVIEISATSVQLEQQLDMNSYKIVNLLDPTLSQDAVTLNYFNTHSLSSTSTLNSIATANPTSGSVNMNNNDLINTNIVSNSNLDSLDLSTTGQVNLDVANVSVVEIIASLVSIEQPLSMTSHQIHLVSDPTSSQDAATKNYVDNSSLPINSTLNAISIANPTSGSVDMNNNDLINTNIVSNSNLDSLDLSTSGQINLNIANTPVIEISATSIQLEQQLDMNSKNIVNSNLIQNTNLDGFDLSSSNNINLNIAGMQIANIQAQPNPTDIQTNSTQFSWQIQGDNTSDNQFTFSGQRLQKTIGDQDNTTFKIQQEFFPSSTNQIAILQLALSDDSVNFSTGAIKIDGAIPYLDNSGAQITHAVFQQNLGSESINVYAESCGQALVNNSMIMINDAATVNNPIQTQFNRVTGYSTAIAITEPQQFTDKNYVDNSSFLPSNSTLNSIAATNLTSGSVDMNSHNLVNTNAISNSNLDGIDLSTTGQSNINIANTPVIEITATNVQLQQNLDMNTKNIINANLIENINLDGIDLSSANNINLNIAGTQIANIVALPGSTDIQTNSTQFTWQTLGDNTQSNNFNILGNRDVLPSSLNETNLNVLQNDLTPENSISQITVGLTAGTQNIQIASGYISALPSGQQYINFIQGNGNNQQTIISPGNILDNRLIMYPDNNIIITDYNRTQFSEPTGYLTGSSIVISDPLQFTTKDYVDNSSFLPSNSTLNAIAATNLTSGSVDMNSNLLTNLAFGTTTNQALAWGQTQGTASVVTEINDVITTPNSSVTTSSTQIQMKIPSVTNLLTFINNSGQCQISNASGIILQSISGTSLTLPISTNDVNLASVANNIFLQTLSTKSIFLGNTTTGTCFFQCNATNNVSNFPLSMNSNKITDLTFGTATNEALAWGQTQGAASVVNQINDVITTPNSSITMSATIISMKIPSVTNPLVFQNNSGLVQIGDTSGIVLQSISGTSITLPISTNDMNLVCVAGNVTYNATVTTKLHSFQVNATPVLTIGASTSATPYINAQLNAVYNSLQPNSLNTSTTTNNNYLISKQYLVNNPNNQICSDFINTTQNPATGQSQIYMNGPVIDFYANVSATLYTLILNHTLSTSWTETTTSNFLLESNNTTTYAGINLNGSSTNLQLITGTSTNKMLTQLTNTSTTDIQLNFSGVSSNLTTAHIQLNGSDLIQLTAATVTLQTAATLSVNTIALTTAGNNYIACAPIHITGTATNQSLTNPYTFFQQGSVALTTSSATRNISILTTGSIVQQGAFCAETSSAILKIQIRNEQQCTQEYLEKFQKIQFHEYKYKNQQWDQSKRLGIYAEELNELFPDFCNIKEQDFIPNIYRKSQEVYINQKIYNVIFIEKIHINEIKKNNNKIKVISDLGEEYNDCKLIDIDENQCKFSCDNKIEFNQQLFIFGQYDEYICVNKTGLLESSLICTKYLLNQNQELNNKIQTLEQRIEKLEMLLQKLL